MPGPISDARFISDFSPARAVGFSGGPHAYFSGRRFPQRQGSSEQIVMSRSECSRLQLFFRAEGLADTDTFSKSDPYLVLYERRNSASSGAGGGRMLIGRTEIINNNLNPRWTTSFTVPFHFESRQIFDAELYDDDGKGPGGGDDALGVVSFQLAHVVGSAAATLKQRVTNGKGSLFVTGVETSESANRRDTIRLQFAGRDLRKMDTFGLSDPYFRLFRLQPNGTKTQLHLSNVIDKTLTPIWQPVEFKVRDLCGADPAALTLRFEMFDKDFFSDDSMGWFECSFNDLLEVGAGRKTFDPRKPHKPDNRYGVIYLAKCELRQVPSFTQLLATGLQMNVMVSIDFTGSNGDPRMPTSLHYMNPMSPNQYVRAIMSVGDILMEYDTDKQIPAFGFGARLPDGNVNMCFHLNFEQNPYVQGIQGVLDSYGRALATVMLSGPTNFSPTVTTANRLSRSSPGVYTVLLILTDGDITDMQATIDAICDADDAPLSIIIVGVGNGCDFALMNQLDGDTEPLRSSRGKPCRRDLVQFVPFRDFAMAPPMMLAAAVLEELPNQVVDWALLSGYRPPVVSTGVQLGAAAPMQPLPQPAIVPYTVAPPSCGAPLSHDNGAPSCELQRPLPPPPSCQPQPGCT